MELSKEEFAGGMGQKGYAAAKDAQAMLSMEEYALRMGQRSDYVAVKDAQIEVRKEECVSGMVQSSNDAATKDVQIKFRKEECAPGMGQSAIQTMNLLHLDHFSNRLPLVNSNPTRMSLEVLEDEEP